MRDFSGKPGGLNGSTEHFPEVYSPESENPKFVEGVDLGAPRPRMTTRFIGELQRNHPAAILRLASGNLT